MPSDLPSSSNGSSKRKLTTGKSAAKKAAPKRTRKARSPASDSDDASPRKTRNTKATATKASTKTEKEDQNAVPKSAAKTGARKKAINTISRAMNAEDDFIPTYESGPRTTEVKPTKPVRNRRLPRVPSSRDSSSDSHSYQMSNRWSTSSTFGGDSASSHVSRRHSSSSVSFEPRSTQPVRVT
ncbi:hypothetical protein V5799_004017 [Amblyomma americanum]|uniref:Uncharacterized protein n=1 Tax=Amblyomma americanum TaxID=6943 RepID=A0AAQ4D7B3_AMBAM